MFYYETSYYNQVFHPAFIGIHHFFHFDLQFIKQLIFKTGKFTRTDYKSFTSMLIWKGTAYKAKYFPCSIADVVP